MTVIKCMERCADRPQADDTGWASNAQRDQLFFPSITSCLTVALVFENGMLGGHAAIMGGEHFDTPQPAQNLKAVLQRMIERGEHEDRGELKKVAFVGNTGEDWDFTDAAELIEDTYGHDPMSNLVFKNINDSDVVCDTGSQKLYAAPLTKDRKSDSAEAAIRDAQINESLL